MNDKNKYLTDEEKNNVTGSLIRVRKGEPFALTLHLDGLFPSRIYKERGFQLKFFVKTLEGEMGKLQDSNVFRIILATTDDNPVILFSNISGKKILRGSVDGRPNEDGFIEFKNIVVNEVSSHYTNGCFSLIIMCLDNPDIKPFVREKIFVRARKALKHRKIISK